MDLRRYELTAGRLMKTFEFASEGPNGKIAKLIRFDKTDVERVYNLAFGDKSRSNQIDDQAISNNGDTQKVLATVARAVEIFTSKYPSSWIYAKGSTQSRTRLYQMGINRYLSDILEDFAVLGLTDGEWKKFQRGVIYDAFLVTRKKVILNYEKEKD
jgi:hypothetical protein